MTFLTVVMTEKYNKTANKWLAAFVFGLCLLSLSDLIRQSEASLPGIKKIISVDLIIFMLPPALYLAIISFIQPTKKFKLKDSMFFLPFMIDLLTKLRFIVFHQSGDLTPQYLDKAYFSSGWYKTLFLIFSCCFLAASIFGLRRHQKRIKELSSNVQRIDLKWLYYLLSAMPLLLLTSYIFNFSNMDWLINLADLVQVGVLFYMGYHIILQKEIFPYTIAELSNIEKIIGTKNTSAPSQLTEAQVKEKILTFLQYHKPYLENDLTLTKLAARLGFKSHYLSYFLNNHLNKNFYSLINEFRVEESKNILRDTSKSHLNMLGVAFESGFNSKTAFNTTFRKMTGITPSEFRKNHKN
ncbi:helix-turn-helix domain-containing protein [Sinomicrobium sp. M5D2P9]